jgi:hypothetical protein
MRLNPFDKIRSPFREASFLNQMPPPIRGRTSTAMRLLLAIVFLGMTGVFSNNDVLVTPRVVKVTTDGGHNKYGGDGPCFPDGVYLRSREINGAPSYSRDTRNEQETMIMYRTSNGLWIMTSKFSDIESNRGSFMTMKSSVTPVAQSWR